MCVEEANDEDKTRLQKTNAAKKVVAKARDEKQQELCERFEEDGGIYLQAG